MSVFSRLLERKSHGRLSSPAPTREELSDIFKLVLRAPDHALLKPWRYLVFSSDSLQQLGEYFAQASRLDNPDISEEQLQKIANKPLRAPMVVISIVCIKTHPKVPEVEQILSSGAAVQNLLMGAHLKGIGAKWRTGPLAFSRNLMDVLGLKANEQITGFIYLGQEEGRKASLNHPQQSEFIEWFE